MTRSFRLFPFLFLPVLASVLLLTAHIPVRAADLIPQHDSAPELVGGPWLNTAPGATPTLARRRGKVTIVEFWTYSCINCRRNLPAYARWAQQLAQRDVIVIGVHTPETEPERDPKQVERQVRALGITYPVLLDEQSKNWERWQQQFWPTVYLVDKKGQIRYRWEGELDYHHAGGEAQVTRLVDQLLAEPQ